jgi:uncharacterized iron-regulated membrane protein
MSGVVLGPPTADERQSRSRRAKVATRPRKRMSRAAYYVHLWLGVLGTVALVAISVTGILLNHKRGLGLMPDVPHEPTAPFASAISLDRMAYAALEAAPQEARGTWKTGDPVDVGLIDRMDVRPRDGFVKVRLRDKASMEMTVDIASGKVIHVGRRGDVFLEKLHSGEIFGGQPFVLLSDIAAVALVAALISGYWLWLAPKWSRTRATDGDGET